MQQLDVYDHSDLHQQLLRIHYIYVAVSKLISGTALLFMPTCICCGRCCDSLADLNT